MDDKATPENTDKSAQVPAPEAHPATESDQVAASAGQPAVAPSLPAHGQSAVRDAYLARAAASASAGADRTAPADLSAAVSIRGAYMARLGDGAAEGVGAGASGDDLLRSVYAARAGSAREPASDGRRRAAPKKTRAGRKAAAKKAATNRGRRAGAASKKARGKAQARAVGVKKSRKAARSAKPARAKATRSTRIARRTARRPRR